MPADQFALAAAGAGEEERHPGRAMDSDPAQLRIAGEFIPPGCGFGGLANLIASSRPTARTSRAAHPAHAKVHAANERAIVAGLERHHRGYGTGHYPRHCGGRTRPAQVGGLSGSELQEERRRDWEGLDRDVARRTSLRLEAVVGDVRLLHPASGGLRRGDQPRVCHDAARLGSGGIEAAAGEEAQHAQQECAQESNGGAPTLEAHRGRGYFGGERHGRIQRAEGHHGMWHRYAPVPERREFLFVVGTGAQARDLGGKSVEEQDAENEEPRGTSVQNGGAISEGLGLRLRLDVQALPGAHGQPPGDRRHRARHCARGLSDVKVQSGIRRDRRNRIRKEV